ncbi:hypothetical protein KO506_11295 [Polaribacter vadi]|uniref:ABC-three component system protein n=1 Tax=Polaribacter TaxID=52959 RepID=UPI001C09F874|nr:MULTISPECIES: ABC-three component system protein [Polaribacter]MBU3011991.1 hypothetical protein [Polaribacter vadi]MDO6741806.1 hypothetical protein [Polaribacter sp. 1_MG-2023]
MDFTFNLAFNINNDDFEVISNNISERIKGSESIYFSSGKDGGKDGRRIGFFKDLDKWKNSGSKFIIQAKHTSNPVGSCSEKSFFGNTKSIIAEETVRVKKLYENGELEYYILFTNRKYSGGVDSKIRKYISKNSGVDFDNIEIIGIETLNEWLSLKINKDIVSRFKLESYQVPFDFSEQDIKDIVIEFKDQLFKINEDIKEKVIETQYNFKLISKTEKNKKNNLSKLYYEQVILNTSLPYFNKIEYFLELEKNDTVKEIYFDIVNELNDLIILKRDKFGAFEEVFDFIYNRISSDSDYKGKKRYIRFLLHYMYYSCSIGIK